MTRLFRENACKDDSMRTKAFWIAMVLLAVLAGRLPPGLAVRGGIPYQKFRRWARGTN